MASALEEGNRVVKHVMDSGAFDDIRKNVFEELRHSSSLRDYVREQVQGSKTLSAENGKPSKDRKKVLDDLQNELKDKLVERASRVIWEILTKADGRVAQDIEQKVHQAICHIQDERERQHAGGSSQQLPPTAAAPPGPAVASEAGPVGAALPPRPAGILLTASLAGQPHQQPSRPPLRHYGLYGQS